jgi:hypothetical protein
LLKTITQDNKITQVEYKGEYIIGIASGDKNTTLVRQYDFRNFKAPANIIESPLKALTTCFKYFNDGVLFGGHNGKVHFGSLEDSSKSYTFKAHWDDSTVMYPVNAFAIHPV